MIFIGAGAGKALYAPYEAPNSQTRPAMKLCTHGSRNSSTTGADVSRVVAGAFAGFNAVAIRKLTLSCGDAWQHHPAPP